LRTAGVSTAKPSVETSAMVSPSWPSLADHICGVNVPAVRLTIDL
jgi:hypothetical protein